MSIDDQLSLSTQDKTNEEQLYYSKDGQSWEASVSGLMREESLCDDYLYKHLSYDEYMSIAHPKQSESDIYIDEYDAVDSKRRALYTQMSDPLYNKARRLERNGEIEKANDYYAQADAAVDKIEIENPWPVNPETL